MPFSDPSSSRPAGPSDTLRVWDLFVRLFHWSVVTAFALALITPDMSDLLHQGAGYLILVLCLLRVIWGFIGPEHARFRSFLRPPAEIMSFLVATLRLRAPRSVGHNPAGGAMVVALIGLLLVITVSGVLQTLPELADARWPEVLHEGAVALTLGLIGLHLVGVLIASIEHGDNLVRSMITGFKRRGDQA